MPCRLMHTTWRRSLIQPWRLTCIRGWVAVSQQFGMGYDEIRMFRRAFKVALSQVQAVYREARVKPGTGGLTLWHSSPPVKRRLFPTFMGKSQK